MICAGRRDWRAHRMLDNGLDDARQVGMPAQYFNIFRFGF